MTERSYFQPKPEVREKMRRPIPFLHENIEEFLKNFLKDRARLELSIWLNRKGDN